MTEDDSGEPEYMTEGDPEDLTEDQPENQSEDLPEENLMHILDDLPEELSEFLPQGSTPPSLPSVPGFTGRQRRKLELQQWMEDAQNEKESYERKVESAVEWLRSESVDRENRVYAEIARVREESEARISQLRDETDAKVVHLQEELARENGPNERLITLLLDGRNEWCSDVDKQLEYAKEQLEDLELSLGLRDSGQGSKGLSGATEEIGDLKRRLDLVSSKSETATKPADQLMECVNEEVEDLKRQLEISLKFQTAAEYTNAQVVLANKEIDDLRRQLLSLEDAQAEAKRTNEQLSLANKQIEFLRRQLENSEDMKDEQLEQTDEQATASSQTSLQTKAVPPSQVFCPITKEIMTDPVIAADGYTYERAAIQSIFDESSLWNQPKSVVTGAELANLDLIENVSIRNLASKYLKQQAIERNAERAARSGSDVC